MAEVRALRLAQRLWCRAGMLVAHTQRVVNAGHARLSARLVPIDDPGIYEWAEVKRREADYLAAHPEELAAYRDRLDARMAARISEMGEAPPVAATRGDEP